MISDYECRNFTPESWISLWLLFKYSDHSVKSFSSFVKTLCLRARSNSSIIANTKITVSLKDVVSKLKLIFSQKGNLVFFIDECLRPLQQEFCDEISVMDMMQTLWQLQDRGIIVISSCLTTAFLVKYDRTDASQRPLNKKYLHSWSDEESNQIIKLIFKDSYASYSDLIVPLVSVLSGLPRAFELLCGIVYTHMKTINSVVPHAKFLFSQLVSELKLFYPASFSTEMLLLALCGEDIPSDMIVMKQTGMTMLMAIRHGFFDTGCLERTEQELLSVSFIVDMSLVKLISYCSELPILEKIIFSSFQIHRNLFEELVRRRFLLQFQLYSTQHLQDVSLLKILRGLKVLGGSFDISITLSIPLDFTTESIFNVNPSPNSVDASSVFKLFVPQKDNETGTDTLIFFPKPKTDSHIVLAIQNKRCSSSFGGKKLVNAIEEAFKVLNSQGWALEDIYLVFILSVKCTELHISVTHILKQNGLNVGILSDDSFKFWCGPTYSSLVQRNFQIEDKFVPKNVCIFKKSQSFGKGSDIIASTLTSIRVKMAELKRVNKHDITETEFSDG